MKLLSFLFFIIGIALLSFGGYQLYLRENPNKLAFNDYKATNMVSVDQKKSPVRLSIKDVGIDVPLIPTQLSGNTWQTTDKGASYLTSSPIPGNEGNSVIYAHNWNNLFGGLVHAKVGQEVQVVYPDNTVKTFIISYTSEVLPTESTILAPSKDNRITLYTCTGFLDSKRFVAVAILKS